MRIILLLTGWLLLAGCASEEPAYTVNVHFLPQQEVQELAQRTSGKSYPYIVYGFAARLDVTCEIYMISREEAESITYGYVNADGSTTFLSGAPFYEWLLGHENRHCIEGSFHP